MASYNIILICFIASDSKALKKFMCNRSQDVMKPFVPNVYIMNIVFMLIQPQ